MCPGFGPCELDARPHSDYTIRQTQTLHCRSHGRAAGRGTCTPRCGAACGRELTDLLWVHGRDSPGGALDQTQVWAAGAFSTERAQYVRWVPLASRGGPLIGVSRCLRASLTLRAVYQQLQLRCSCDGAAVGLLLESTGVIETCAALHRRR